MRRGMSKAHEIVKAGMSLAVFFRRYPTDEAAGTQFAAWRWPHGVRCPHCGSANISTVASRRPQPCRCRKCRRHFSYKTDTPMHDSKLGAHTWPLGLFLVVSNPEGRSSVQLAADLGITQKSAWHLGHRIREALADGSLPGFEGPVEIDETFIGGKAKNMRASVRAHRIHGRGAVDKTPVVGVRDRATNRVTARPTADTTSATPTGMVADVTRPGSTVFTDGDRCYDPLKEMGHLHAKVAHSAGEYVRGPVSTNGIENYWSGLKRTCIGTYHWWSDDHLHRYVDEHTFRYNRRGCHVTDRMRQAAQAMEGRRLPWRGLVANGPHTQTGPRPDAPSLTL